MLHLRIRRLYTAIAGHRVTELEASHPEAVLDYEREQLRIQVASYNKNLAGHAGLCERLRVRGRNLEKEEGVLHKRIERFLGAEKRERAAELALRLEAVSRERTELAAQLSQAEETYQDLIKSRDAAIDSARAKLEALKRSISDVKVQSALAEISEMSACMQGGIGVSEGTLERVHEKLEEKREVAVGRTRVARDHIDVSAIEEDEEEREILAQEALARFEAGKHAGASGPQTPDDDLR